MPSIIWTDYLKYRTDLRGFDIAQLEQIVRYSGERYRDTETGRSIVIGRHNTALVMIAYETYDHDVTPVTVHAVSRQQIKFRVQTGRFTNE